MMKLHELSPTAGSRKQRKRVGRGDSSGHGKTAGRGNKGASARSGSKRRPFFEGGQITFFRRLPKRGFNKPDHIEYTLINLDVLEQNFSEGDCVNESSLRSKNLLGKTTQMIKVLANGNLTKPLTVRVDKLSVAAKAKIEAVGGKVELRQ